MAELEIARSLDLKGVACPDNFVRTILTLEEMEVGQILEVILQGQEVCFNVPRSVKQSGHTIVHSERPAEGMLRLLIRKEANA